MNTLRFPLLTLSAVVFLSGVVGCDGNLEYGSDIDAPTPEPSDEQAPVLALLGVEDGAEYPPNTKIMPDVEASDDSGEAPLVHLTLDGEDWEQGAVIDQAGFHLLRASAEDASGNIREQVVSFQILARPKYEPLAVLVDSEFTTLPNAELPQQVITLALAPDSALEMPFEDIQLARLQLHPMTDSGLIEGAVPLQVPGVEYDPEWGVSDETIGGAYFDPELAVLFVTFAGDLPADTSRLMLTGGGPGFDLHASLPYVVGGSSLAGLIEQHPALGAPGIFWAPDPEAVVPCRFKWNVNELARADGGEGYADYVSMWLLDRSSSSMLGAGTVVGIAEPQACQCNVVCSAFPVFKLALNTAEGTLELGASSSVTSTRCGLSVSATATLVSNSDKLGLWDAQAVTPKENSFSGATVVGGGQPPITVDLRNQFEFTVREGSKGMGQVSGHDFQLDLSATCPGNQKFVFAWP